MRDAMFGLNLIYQIPFFGETAEQAWADWVDEDRKTVVQTTNPVKSVYKKWHNGVKYDDADKILKAAQVLTEIGVGVQADPLVGLAEIFTDGMDEDAMYDLLGVSYSYRPTNKKKKSKSTEDKPSNKEVQDMLDKLAD